LLPQLKKKKRKKKSSRCFLFKAPVVMGANQITGSEVYSLPSMFASTGNAVCMMETPINHFILWWQLGTVFAFCTGHLYFISL